MPISSPSYPFGLAKHVCAMFTSASKLRKLVLRRKGNWNVHIGDDDSVTMPLACGFVISLLLVLSLIIWGLILVIIAVVKRIRRATSEDYHN